MGNVEILYEGPFWGMGREQIAMSLTGKWFSRNWGAHGGVTKSAWKEIEQPRRPRPDDKVFHGYDGSQGPHDPADPFAHFYRSPTYDECENCIKGAQGYLRLVSGHCNLRVPLSRGETAALRERRQLHQAASTSHSHELSRATRL